MGIEKTELMACESIYWISINVSIKNHIKILYMSWFSSNTFKRKDNTPQNSSKTMGDSWHRYVYLTQ